MSKVPNHFPVKELEPEDAARDRVTCNTCGRSWDDAIPTEYTPSPSARCPFEAYHETLDSLVRSVSFENFREVQLGNDLFINDPERADRIHAAAEYGADGSTHDEVLQDYRDFLSLYEGTTETERESIEKEIDKLEAFHAERGTLYMEIG